MLRLMIAYASPRDSLCFADCQVMTAVCHSYDSLLSSSWQCRRRRYALSTITSPSRPYDANLPYTLHPTLFALFSLIIWGLRNVGCLPALHSPYIHSTYAIRHRGDAYFSQLFNKGRTIIVGHISNIFREGELEEKSLCRANVGWM